MRYTAVSALLPTVNVTAAGPITSIHDISGGTTIDFDTPLFIANPYLSAFDMTSPQNPDIAKFVSVVTGNDDAPISKGGLYGSDIRFRTTGRPWLQIGATGVGNEFGKDRFFTLRAFGDGELFIGSVHATFAPVDASIDSYNAAARFLGWSSTVPIYSIELTEDRGDSNSVWGGLRFLPVPEPSTAALLVIACVGALVVRRR
jgi:hypothetical protein